VHLHSESVFLAISSLRQVRKRTNSLWKSKNTGSSSCYMSGVNSNTKIIFIENRMHFMLTFSTIDYKIFLENLKKVKN